MLPFVIFCLRAPPVSLRGGSNSGGTAPADPSTAAVGVAGGGGAVARLRARLWSTLRAVGQDVLLLARHPVYVWTVGGMTFYTAVLGTFAFYGPKAGREVFNIQPERADLTFGAITVLTGTCGTLAGGSLLDAIGSSMRNALLLCTLGVAVGACLAVAAFWGAASFTLFSVVFALAQLAMFVSAAPSNAVCMWSVPAELRPFAMSMSVVAIHVLGDVPSPPLLGMLQGYLKDWRLSMSIASSLLLLGSLAYYVASRGAQAAPDYREAAEEAESDEEAGSEEGRGDDAQLWHDQDSGEHPHLSLLPSGVDRS